MKTQRLRRNQRLLAQQRNNSDTLSSMLEKLEQRHMLSGSSGYQYEFAIVDKQGQTETVYSPIDYQDLNTLQAPWLNNPAQVQGADQKLAWTTPFNTALPVNDSDSVGFVAARSEYLIDTPEQFREHLLAGTVAEVSDDLIGCLNNGATLGLGGQNALYGTEIMRAWGMTSGSLYELLILNSRYPSQLQQPDSPAPSVFVRDEVIQAMQRIVGFPFSGPSNALQPNAWAPRLSVFSKTDLGNGGFITVNPPDQTVKNLDIHVPTNQSLFDFTNQNRGDLLGSSNLALPKQVFTYLENWYKTAVTNGTNPIDVFSEISGIPNLTNRIENPPTIEPGAPQPASTDAGDPPVYDAYYNPQLNTTANYVIYQDACTAVGGYFANSLIKNQSAINSFFGLFANQRIADRANAISTGDTVTAEQKTKELAIGLRALMALTYDASPLWSSYGIGYSNAANPMVGSLHSTGMPPTDFIDQFAGQEIQLTNIFPPSNTLQIMTSDAEPDPFNDPHPIPTNYLSDGWFTLGPDQQLSGIQYYKNVNSDSFTDSYVINPGSAVYLNPTSTSSDTLRVDEVPGTTFLPLTRSTIIDVDGTSTEIRSLHSLLGHPDVLPAEFATYISLAGGVDRVTGGSLNDVIIGTSKSGNVPVPGRLVVSAGAGQDVVSPGRGGSLVELGPGNDTVIFGIDDLFGETNFLDFVSGEDRIVLDHRISLDVPNVLNPDTIKLSYKHQEKILRNSVGSWDVVEDFSHIDISSGTGKSTSDVTLSYVEFQQIVVPDSPDFNIKTKKLKITIHSDEVPQSFVVNIGSSSGKSFNPGYKTNGHSIIYIPLSDFAAQIKTIQESGPAFQISVTPWMPTADNFGYQQSQVFITNDPDTTPGKINIPQNEVSGTFQANWRVIQDGDKFRVGYAGGLANYLINNKLTADDSTGLTASPSTPNGVDPNHSIVIDLGHERYDVQPGAGSFNLSSRIALYDKRYDTSSEASAQIQNLTGTDVPSSLESDAPKLFSVATDYQVIIRGNAIIDGYSSNNHYSDIQIKNNAPVQNSKWAHYFISTDLLAVTSTFQVADAQLGSTYAIDVSGVTVKWPAKRGYGPTLLQDLIDNAAPGTTQPSANVASPEGPSSGVLFLNTDNSTPLRASLPPGSSGNYFSQSPVKLYNYKQVGGWVDAADGPSIYGQGSFLTNSFIHANDDSIKAQAPHFRATNNTIFQGGAGNPIGFAYGFWNGSASGSFIQRTYIHRISHNQMNCGLSETGSDNPYGLVAMRAIPSNMFGWDYTFKDITVDKIYVPSMNIGGGKFSRINSIWYMSSLDIQGAARRGANFGFAPPSDQNLLTQFNFDIGNIKVTDLQGYPRDYLNHPNPSWVQIGGVFTSHSTPDTRPKVPQGYNPHDVQLKVTAKTPGLNPFPLLQWNDQESKFDQIQNSSVTVTNSSQAKISILPVASMSTVARPKLRRSSNVILVGRSGLVGPDPVSLAYSHLADATLTSTSSSQTTSFFVSKVASGYVEKKRRDGSWVDVSTPITTSNPRALIQLLRNRMIAPGDEIRWVPGTANEGNASAEAFSLYGWDGVSASVEASEIEVGVEESL